MQVFTERRPFPLKTNHYKGLKRKSLVNICRPKLITKPSATTTTHLCSDATSITLMMSVEKKSQDLRLSSEIRQLQKDFISLKKRRLQQIQELLTVTSMSFFSFVHLIYIYIYIYIYG